jgi:hypothetical protein
MKSRETSLKSGFCRQPARIFDDVIIAGEQFTSQIIDSEGEAITFETLYEGQTVMVQGLKLEDGRVVAAVVQVSGDSGVAIKPVRPIRPVE